MREILFRGKDAIGNWHEGNLSLPNSIREYTVIESNSGILFEVIPGTVGQFTGLTDKNGVKIFEGDILFNSNMTLLTSPDDKRLYIVKYQDGKYIETNGKIWLGQNPSFLFEKINHNGKKYMNLIFKQSQIEIVGNIHDNPELLNQ